MSIKLIHFKENKMFSSESKYEKVKNGDSRNRTWDGRIGNEGLMKLNFSRFHTPNSYTFVKTTGI
jgi:hypothetical protein